MVATLFKTIFYAALAAAIILIAQPPDGVPDPKKPASMRLVSGDMMDALEAPTPRAISFTEDEAGDFLKRKLKKKEGAIPGVEFTAYVNFLPGELRIFSENSLWGYPVYSGVYYQIEVKDGKFTTRIVGGTLGRLSVDPQLMQYASAGFDSLWASLQPERKQMDRLLSVKVLDKRIDLVTKGSPLR